MHILPFVEVNQVKILTFPFLNAVFPWYSIQSVLSIEDCIPGDFFYFSKHIVWLIFLLPEMIRRMGLMTSRFYFKMCLACYLTGTNSQWKLTGLSAEYNHNWMGNPPGWELDALPYFPFYKQILYISLFLHENAVHIAYKVYGIKINSKTRQPLFTSAKPLGHCIYTNAVNSFEKGDNNQKEWTWQCK